MNTPPDPLSAWRHLRTHASAQLPAHFADNVLRASRMQPRGLVAFSPTELLHTFFVSASTALACLLVVIIVHSTTTHSTSLEHLADWEEISMQTASLDGAP
jgi:hypothetical protein